MSSVYRSRAAGFEGDDFLNLVVGLFNLASQPQAIVAKLERLHEEAGRVEGRKRLFPANAGPRPAALR